MYNRKYKKGDTIIQYGDMGTDYFVLTSGKVEVTVYQPGTPASDPKLNEKIMFKKLLEANPESTELTQRMIGFGEIALLQNDKRTASIVAQTDCETWVLNGDTFKAIIAVQSIKRRNISLEYLNKVELFAGLEQYEKLKLIDGLRMINLNAGEYVFHQGEQGEDFYIIEEGEVECGKEQEGQFELIRTLESGAYFGEVALINNVMRTLSVRCKANAKLIKLSRKTFNRILGSIKQFLKGDYADLKQN